MKPILACLLIITLIYGYGLLVPVPTTPPVTVTSTVTPLPPTPTPTPKSTWRCDPSGGLACFKALSHVKVISTNEVWVKLDKYMSSNDVMLRYAPQYHAITPSWQFVSPNVITPFHSENTLAVVSPNDIWEVGDMGRITHYLNNHWQNVITPARGQQNLLSIAMLSATDGWAAGNINTLLHYNGQQWQPMPPKGRPYFSSLVSMKVVNGNEIWAVGDGVHYYKNGLWQKDTSPVITNVGFINFSMVSGDEGWFIGSKRLFHYQQGTWQEVTNPTGKYLLSIDMLNENEGWAVGENSIILHYHDGTWEMVSQNRLPDIRVQDLAWLDETQEGWAVGYDSQIYHYQHNQWTKLDIPANLVTPPSLAAIDMVSPTEGWAVGQDKNWQGTLYHFTNGQWDFKPILVTKRLEDVDMLNEKVGLAVGEEGTIQHYRFNNWELRTTPTTHWLSAVHMVSETEAWAVGEKGTILHYTNDTWIDASLHEITDGLTAIKMVSPTAGWILGQNVLLHYHQGKWQSVALPSKETSFTTFTMLNDQEGWLMSGQGVWHYKMGEWDLEESPIQVHGALHMLNAHEGWAVGYGILHYTNQP